MWQFAEVVEGISEACEALGIPVVGGNVSFYNESRGADIHPTPGRERDRADRRAAGRAARPAPSSGGDSIVVLGATRPELGGSEWAAVLHGETGGMPPVADLDRAPAARVRRRDRRRPRGHGRARRQRRRARGRARRDGVRGRGRVQGRPHHGRAARRPRRASPSRRRVSCSPSRATASPRSSAARSPRVSRPRWSATRGATADRERRVRRRRSPMRPAAWRNALPGPARSVRRAESGAFEPGDDFGRGLFAASCPRSRCAARGARGSYGSDTPVNSGISPARALA